MNSKHQEREKRGYGRLWRLLVPIVLAVVFAPQIMSCRRAAEWRSSDGAVWHTSYHIVYAAPTDLTDSINAAFNAIEMSLSPFNPGSLISKINRNETSVTDALIDTIFSISTYVNRASNGRFDPTVSPLVDLWGFGTDKKARQRAETDTAEFTVSQQLIDSALAMVGISDCRITDGRMIKKHAETTFNFSAVTKGYGCDYIADMFRRNGVENFMIEVGGEVNVSGLNPDGRQWHIQIDAPNASDPSAHDALQVISITDRGIATSGNYRNFHTSKQYGRFGHTINPTTGRPAVTDILSATVIAPTTGWADAWATACMASTADSALAMIERQPNVECLLVTVVGDSLRTVTSNGFPTEK